MTIEKNYVEFIQSIKTQIVLYPVQQSYGHRQYAVDYRQYAVDYRQSVI